MPGDLRLTTCPVCGDPLIAVFNNWTPTEGYFSHEAIHLVDAVRERTGLPVKRCSWAEPMTVARRELARELAAGVRAGAVSWDDIVRDGHPDVVRHCQDFLEGDALTPAEKPR